jgi:hypothetical protein
MFDVIMLMVWVGGTAVLLLTWLYFDWFKNGWVFLGILTIILFYLRDLLRRSYIPKQLLQFFLIEIEPQIRQFCIEKRIPRWQVDQMAEFVIPDESPLRRYILSSRK